MCTAIKAVVTAVCTAIYQCLSAVCTAIKTGVTAVCTAVYACVSAICTALRAGVVKTKTTLYTFVFSPIVSLLCVRFRSTRLHAFGHMLPHLNRYIRSCSDPFAVHLTARQPVSWLCARRSKRASPPCAPQSTNASLRCARRSKRASRSAMILVSLA